VTREEKVKRAQRLMDDLEAPGGCHFTCGMLGQPLCRKHQELVRLTEELVLPPIMKRKPGGL
jgi:hypothetical protein